MMIIASIHQFMTAQENSKKKKGNKVDQEAVDSTAQVKNLLTKVSANFQQKLFTIDAAKIPGNRYGSRKNLFARAQMPKFGETKIR